jgi:hypothetical protein
MKGRERQDREFERDGDLLLSPVIAQQNPDCRNKGDTAVAIAGAREAGGGVACQERSKG